MFDNKNIVKHKVKIPGPAATSPGEKAPKFHYKKRSDIIMQKKIENVKVSFSAGNSKMGAIPSVSLPPITTCVENCVCAKKCYAARICRVRPTVASAYERNLAALEADPGAYWLQVKAAAVCSRFFRFHVSGDIPSVDYLRDMARIAEELPHTRFLCFTKKYKIVNYFLSAEILPHNLQLIFSAWPGMEMPNPYNLPVAHVIFKGENPAENWKICGGNCAECACQGVGCWELKRGEHIAFYEH